ncbi:MAG: hydantoinase/oxoprolinase family protein [Proteobacteria bacterium]|nr:hydantoinase/oxoprolinase family protein [Pseudomonadota bacterium]
MNGAINFDPDMRFSIAIDIGGTFTDVVIADSNGKIFKIAKTASTPENPSEGFVHAVKMAMKLANANAKSIDVVLHGSTVATNAILEGKGARTALITTKGFRHVLQIGRAEIPRESNLYGWVKPRRPIYTRDIFEVPERIRYDGIVDIKLDLLVVDQIAKSLTEGKYEAVAIVLLHSYSNPEHEIQIAEKLSKLLPNIEISISSEVLPVFREYERAMVTVINASVQPLVGRYVRQLSKELSGLDVNCPLFIMKSNGGVFPPKEAARSGVYMALSGPAAGMNGAAYLGKMAGFENLITIDMGGTSADIALIRDGNLQMSTAARINEQPLAIPIIDIHTIGAGGGSIASIAPNGAILVGPTSAGANPGPAAYGLGGKLPTVTDANLVLGRIPANLLDGQVTLDVEAAHSAIYDHIAKPLGTTVVEAALGVISIVNETMHNALKLMSVERGLDPSDFLLSAFGGAGPVHGAELMRLLSAGGLLVPRYPGILCANGLLATDLRYDFVVTRFQRAGTFNYLEMSKVFKELLIKADSRLDLDNVPVDRRALSRFVDIRYAGQGTELIVGFPDGEVNASTTASAVEAFHDLHQELYTFADRGAAVEIVNFRIQAIGLRDHLSPPVIGVTNKKSPEPTSTRSVVIDNSGPRLINVYRRDDLLAQDIILGPAIVDQLDSTTFILDGQKADVDKYGNLIIKEVGL